MPFCRSSDLGSVMIHLITPKWTKNSQISKSLHVSLYISSIFKYGSQCTACSEGVQVLRFHFLTFTSRNIRETQTYWFWYWNILKHIDIYLELFHIPSVRNWCTWVRHSTGQRSTEANEAWYRRRSKWWNLEHVHSQLLPHCRAHAVVGFQHPQACHARAANCPSGLAREMKAIMFLISTCIHQPISQSKLWISNQLWRLWHVLPSESLSWKTHFDNAHLDKPSCWGKSRCCLASLGEMTFNSSIYSVTVYLFLR